MSPNLTILYPGDIVLTRGSSWVSRAIRAFTRSPGEAPTKVNHAGAIVTAGPLRFSELVEAISTVVRRNLWAAYFGRDQVSIWRAKNLTPDQRRKVAANAQEYVGRKYGYVKVVAHALDGLLGGAFFFRRMTGMDRYPICSWVVAHAYGKEGFHFGVTDNAATPDDLWDFVNKRKDLYECIFPLGPLKDSGEV